MAKELIVNQENVKELEETVTLCPFGALENNNGKITINAGCRMCGVCTRKEPDIFSFVETGEKTIDYSEWNGTSIYIEHEHGNIHPVSFELIGKALEFKKKIGHPVHAVIIGYETDEMVEEVLSYGVDEVFVYDDERLYEFNIQTYVNAFEDYVNTNRPNIILVGGTKLGRSLAPRIATRFRTGLTADCTILDVQPDGSLDQIRPAFGGNIMAHIYTPNNRPQLSTVRYKIFDKPARTKAHGNVNKLKLSDERLLSDVKILETHKKEVSEGIEDAEVIVACGNIFKKQDDLKIAYELAGLLGAKVACTRPMIEKGWFDPRLQIGLSGRTVRPKLIITLGVSGAIQFTAGMNGSDYVVAINNDPQAQIFKTANLALIGDVFEIVPELIKIIKTGGDLNV